MARLNFREGHRSPPEMRTSYNTYHFRANEQDPVIDRMQTIMEDEFGKGTKGTFSRVHEASGISTTTLSNWFSTRYTRKPQYASIVAFSRAMGYDVALIKTGNKANGKPWEAGEGPQIISRWRKG